MNKIRFANWTVPLALLLTSILAFGLLIPRLGFYWDDWPPQLVRQVYGVQSFWNYYSFDRPFSAWTHVILAPLLGGSPLKWHIFTLVIRWLASIEVWWLLLGLFPNQKRLAAWTTLIFLVYPAFTNQSLSVTFSQHWITFVLFLASMALMVQSIRSRRWFWPLTILALITEAIAHLTMEYFLGIELLRPIFLWILATENNLEPRRKRLVRTFIQWLPFLVVLLGYSAYRLFFFRLSDQDPNAPAFFFQLLHNPLGVVNILKYAVPQDLTQILITSWANTINPALFSSLTFSILPWIFALVSAVLASIYLFKLDGSQFEASSEPKAWIKPALLIALLGLLLGPLPAWMISRQVIDGVHSDRFALPALFGASLLFVILVETSLHGNLRKCILVGILVGLSISMNIRIAQDFAQRWENQQQFFWQLSWRAPSISPSTAVISEEELFPDEGIFATSSALNVLYPQTSKPEKLALWMYALRPRFVEKIPALLNGANFQTDFRIFSFKTTTPNSLLVYFTPQKSTCLWLLRSDDNADPYLSPLLQQALPVSNLDRILAAPSAEGFPPTEIFGQEPSHSSWCYFYQKAELARQENDWKTVAFLGDQARKMGFSPNNSPSNIPHEWIPFIEGYAYSGNPDQALQLSRIAFEQDDRYSARLCILWEKISKDKPSPSNPQEISNFLNQLKCIP